MQVLNDGFQKSILWLLWHGVIRFFVTNFPAAIQQWAPQIRSMYFNMQMQSNLISTSNQTSRIFLFQNAMKSRLFPRSAFFEELHFFKLIISEEHIIRNAKFCIFTLFCAMIFLGLKLCFWAILAFPHYFFFKNKQMPGSEYHYQEK